MEISKLFNKLRSSSTVTLILCSNNTPNSLRYFLTANVVGYSVISSGLCSGTLNKELAVFNISMDAIEHLLSRNYNFNITYNGKELLFISPKNDVTIRPIFVEAIDLKSIELMERFIKCDAQITNSFDVTSLKQQITQTENLIGEYDDKLSNIVEELQSFNPNSTVKELDFENTSFNTNSNYALQNYSQELDKLENLKAQAVKDLTLLKGEYSKLKDTISVLTPLNLQSFKNIIAIASKVKTSVSFCNSFATVSLKSSHVLYTDKCVNMSIYGWLLNTLLDFGGMFFQYKDGTLIYNHVLNNTVTRVFIDTYLPNTDVTLSLLQREPVIEKYTVNIDNLISITKALGVKYNQITVDMNTGVISISNEIHEQVDYKFNILASGSTEFNRNMKSSNFTPVKLSIFSIPYEVVNILDQMKGNINIYVKQRKIIFHQDNLYIVFGKEIIK